MSKLMYGQHVNVQCVASEGFESDQASARQTSVWRTEREVEGNPIKVVSSPVPTTPCESIHGHTALRWTYDS